MLTIFPYFGSYGLSAYYPLLRVMAPYARKRRKVERIAKQGIKKALRSSRRLVAEPTHEERFANYPAEFHPPNWPIYGIFNESGTHYLVLWKPDPKTGFEYPEQWVSDF